MFFSLHLLLLLFHTSNRNNRVNLFFDLPDSTLDPLDLLHHHAHRLVHRLLIVQINLGECEESTPANNQESEQVEPRAYICEAVEAGPKLDSVDDRLGKKEAT